jgi:hypothetical protein
MTVRIKLLPKPYYQGQKSLEGVPYQFKFYWNTTTLQWYMAMKGITNDVEIRGTALLCGKELIGKHGYNDILGDLHLVDSSGANEAPTFEGMGDRWTLEYTPLESATV